MSKKPVGPNGISSITVSGFKSIEKETTLEIRPLTLLAGANSSGKSSIMQALLLLKQTLEAPYDPGPLLLNGPNVRFSKAEQLFTKLGETRGVALKVGVAAGGQAFSTTFVRDDHTKRLEVSRTEFGESIVITTTTTASEFLASVKPEMRRFIQDLAKVKGGISVTRSRCFLILDSKDEVLSAIVGGLSSPLQSDPARLVPAVIHVPGLRGNPARSYRVTAFGPSFPGTFEEYTATVIHRWQNGDHGTLKRLSVDLQSIGLTSTIRAEQIDDTQVALLVGRLPTAHDDTEDLVNIADVGFGVSQVLPVVVALHAAKPGQLVYVEQPEIHLHPQAQTALARVLADAAKRGVRVVAETHSSLLLRGVQTLVAQGEISKELVKLHWFQRDSKTGATTVTSGELDEAGRFGDWPEDFDDVALESEGAYLDAVEKRLSK